MKKTLGTIQRIKYLIFHLKNLPHTKVIITNFLLQKLSYTNSLSVEQNHDVILQKLRLKILKESYSETILVQDTRYQHYCRQMDRLSVMDEITRQYFDETGAVKYNQVLLPKHLVQELL